MLGHKKEVWPPLVCINNLRFRIHAMDDIARKCPVLRLRVASAPNDLDGFARQLLVRVRSKQGQTRADASTSRYNDHGIEHVGRKEEVVSRGFTEPQILWRVLDDVSGPVAGIGDDDACLATVLGRDGGERMPLDERIRAEPCRGNRRHVKVGEGEGDTTRRNGPCRSDDHAAKEQPGPDEEKGDDYQEIDASMLVERRGGGHGHRRDPSMDPEDGHGDPSCEAMAAFEGVVEAGAAPGHCRDADD